MLTAPDGYSRKRKCTVPTRTKRNPADCYRRHFRYRSMSIDEAKTIDWTTALHALFQDGEIMRVRQNGAVKTWKRDPNRVEIPVKFGAYSRGQFRSVSQSDGTMSDLVVLLDEHGNPTQSEDSATVETE